MMLESVLRQSRLAYDAYWEEFREEWSLKWPGQVVQTISCQTWTKEVSGGRPVACSVCSRETNPNPYRSKMPLARAPYPTIWPSAMSKSIALSRWCAVRCRRGRPLRSRRWSCWTCMVSISMLLWVYMCHMLMKPARGLRIIMAIEKWTHGVACCKKK